MLLCHLAQGFALLSTAFSFASMKRSISEIASDEESTGAAGLDDIRLAVASKDHKFCVQWDHFEYDEDSAKENAVSIVKHPDVEAWYVGACKDPYDRFFEQPSPHCVRFHCCYPVWLGKKAGDMEKEVLRHSRWTESGQSKCQNAPSSKGGEGISPLSIRFVYVCVRWTRASLRIL